MSKSNLKPIPGYRDPLTTTGTPFGGGAESIWFHLHEAGCQRLGTIWTHSQVQSPFWRLYWNDRPGAWIECQGKRFPLTRSRLLLVPAHTIFNTHGSVRLVNHFWIHFSLHPDLTTRDSSPIEVPWPRQSRIAALARDVRADKPETRARRFHLCSALLHQAFAQSDAGERQSRLPAKFRLLLNDIELSLARPITVAHLAGRAGMSRGGFIRWFRLLAEVSPARYVLQRRIDHACRMLKFSPMTIEAIAESLGFANRNHFSRVFQRHMRCGPATFRRS